MPYTLFDPAVQVYDDYIAKQLDLPNPIHRAAIWGNGGEESAGFTQMHQTGGHARGGWQWDDRRDAYEAFCTQKGVDPDTIQASVWFLVHELLNSENHSLVQLKKTTTLDAATYTFMKLYERPGVPAEDVRLRWAERALTIITAKQKGTTMTDAPTLPGVVQGPPVDQLAEFIKAAELKVEDVIRALLVAKGVPSFIIDFVFSQLNQVDLAALIRHIDLNALLQGVFQQRK